MSDNFRKGYELGLAMHGRPPALVNEPRLIDVEPEPTIKTFRDLFAVLDDISFANSVLDFKWQFDHRMCGDEGWFVWATFERPDAITGEIGRGRGREEIIWRGSTVSSVVKTCWLLVELLVRHELMEGFRYRGQRIFNPHHTVGELSELAQAHERRREGAAE